MPSAFHSDPPPNLALAPEVEAVQQLQQVHWTMQQVHHRLAATNMLLAIAIVVLVVIAWLLYLQRPITTAELTGLSGDALTKRRMSIPISRVTGSVAVDH